MRKSIHPFIKLLIGEPLVLKNDSGAFRKFVGGEGQDLAYIHSSLLSLVNLLNALAL
jgi:hypothetical protein